MNSFNAALTSVTDGMFSAAANWPPIVTLVVLSVVVGVIMAIVFRYTSRQEALGRVADLTRAQVLAIKLFKDDLRTMFSSLGRLLCYTVLRLWHSLPPALVMFIPFTILLVQTARWYEYRPLMQGERAVLEMTLSPEAWPRVEQLKLTPADGVVIETRHLDPEEPIASWNIRADASLPTTIAWQLGDEHGEKRIAVADSLATSCAVDQQIAGTDVWARILYPGEPAFDKESAVQSIVIHAIDPHRKTPVFGLNVPWWLTLLIVSMATAFLVRPLVGVQF